MVTHLHHSHVVYVLLILSHFDNQFQSDPTYINPPSTVQLSNHTHTHTYTVSHTRKTKNKTKKQSKKQNKNTCLLKKLAKLRKKQKQKHYTMGGKRPHACFSPSKNKTKQKMDHNPRKKKQTKLKR